MGDGGLPEEADVVGVDSHLLDCLPNVELVVSTALQVGIRNIIEPSEIWRERGRLWLASYLEWAIRRAVAKASPPYNVLDFVKHGNALSTIA